MAYDGQTEFIDLDVLAEFNNVTEWKKDMWTSDKTFIANTVDYI